MCNHVYILRRNRREGKRSQNSNSTTVISILHQLVDICYVTTSWKSCIKEYTCEKLILVGFIKRLLTTAAIMCCVYLVNVLPLNNTWACLVIYTDSRYNADGSLIVDALGLFYILNAGCLCQKDLDWAVNRPFNKIIMQNIHQINTVSCGNTPFIFCTGHPT